MGMFSPHKTSIERLARSREADERKRKRLARARRNAAASLLEDVVRRQRELGVIAAVEAAAKVAESIIESTDD